jgi:signal transduction histidine kinase
MWNRVIGCLHRGGWQQLVLLLGLGGFVISVYLIIVLGGGALIGHLESPHMALSVLATAVVALLFAPIQTFLGQVATTSAGGRQTPYDVLSRFSRAATGSYPTEGLPDRMAELLAEGTGARWAQVWLAVSGHLTLAATWPTDAEADPRPPDWEPGSAGAGPRGRRALPVRHGGDLLGVLRLQERPGLALTAVEERLFAGLAAQSGLVLRLVVVRAELEDRHAELAARAAELAASRERLIETQDVERRRLERDIHDGAQQHLVALALNLRLAQRITGRSPQRARQVLHEQAGAARLAIETLSSLSRGIYPRMLAAEGLGPALQYALATSSIPVTIDAEGVSRLPATVEAALYFCCMEAVQNAAKHSGAAHVAVRLYVSSSGSHLTVTDDGSGFLEAPDRVAGVGLTNMRDRMDAAGGTVSIDSLPASGTRVTASVPTGVI